MMTKTFLLAAILALLLNGCATKPVSVEAVVPEEKLLSSAQQAEREGHYEASAREYIRLAEQSSLLKQAQYYLQAANVLLKGNFNDQAKRLLLNIEPESLHAHLLVQRQVLLAKIALAENRIPAVLELLDIDLPPSLAPELSADAYGLRAAAYLRQGNELESVRQQIQRLHYIRQPDQRLQVQRVLWQTLAQTSEQSLQRLQLPPPPNEFSGWIELARIARAELTEADAMSNQLTKWHQRYPGHPAALEIIDAILDRQQKILRLPNAVALLLPFNSRYRTPAEVIRDGFLAAHYEDKKPNKPSVRIYDASTFDSIVDAYDQAVADGAQFIVGPLDKEQVTRLAKHGPLPVPALSLNASDDERLTTPGLFQFGLSPEDEARQVAERAWLDGHNQAIVMAPEGQWGDRVVEAFATSWEMLGGTLMSIQQYPSDNNDFSKQLKALLEIDQSQTRYRQLKALIGQDLRFEPRRRQDTDYIFMAAYPRQARLIRPQLKFHYAGDLPVYATSHIFTGKENRYKDRDMDDVIFCDTLWTLDDTAYPLKRKIRKLWPEQESNYTRLYALGIDAYQLIPQVEHLQKFAHERFNGATGLIHVNGQGQLFRQLKWAQFDKGIPILRP